MVPYGRGLVLGWVSLGESDLVKGKIRMVCGNGVDDLRTLLKKDL